MSDVHGRRPRRRRRRRHGRGARVLRPVGFADVLFDYTGRRAREPATARRGSRCSATRGATPVGPGRIKLVQVLDGDGPPPAPDGRRLGRARRSARSACTPAASRASTRSSSPRAARVADGAARRRGRAERRLARHRLRRRPVGRQARADRVDGPLAVAARRAAGRGREPRRLRRRRHGAHARVLRAARLHGAAVRVDRVLRADGALVRRASRPTSTWSCCCRRRARASSRSSSTRSGPTAAASGATSARSSSRSASPTSSGPARAAPGWASSAGEPVSARRRERASGATRTSRPRRPLRLARRAAILTSLGARALAGARCACPRAPTSCRPACSARRRRRRDSRSTCPCRRRRRGAHPRQSSCVDRAFREEDAATVSPR